MGKSILRTSFSVLALAIIVLTSSFVRSENRHATLASAAVKCKSGYLASPYKEFILKVNEINEKNYNQIRSSIENGGGFIFRGYCPNLKVLMYLVDRNMHPDNSFLNKLTALNFTYEIKDGSNIAAVTAACGLSTDGNPTVITE